MTLDPYARTTHDGKPVDEITHQALLAAEKILGYPLTIVQGSYRAGNGPAASAGTHDGGGVVDLLSWDWENKVRALRTVGFAAWRRTPDQGRWREHIHAVLIGNQKLSPSAARQVESYKRHRDGLKGDGPDLFPFHPDGVVFHMPDAPRPTRHATANIKSNPLMPVAKASADIRAVAVHAGVIGWQEIHHTYRPSIRALASFTTYWPGKRFSADANAVPISWRTRRFKLIASGVKRTHFGRPGVTPARYIAWVVLEDVATGERHWRINTHYISAAWSRHPERRPLWEKHDRKLAKIVLRLIWEHGPNGVIGADFNRDIGSPRLTGIARRNGGKRRVGQHYDWLYVFGGAPTPETKLPLNSDHDAVISRVTFTPKESK